jgi:quinol monooxygenase YgiN
MTKALVVRFTLQPGGAEGFDALTAETVTEIRRREPGTLVYAVHAVPGEPDRRLFYELYRDEEAFQEHERQPHTRRFLEARGQYLSDVQVEFGTTLVTSGVPALEEN